MASQSALRITSIEAFCEAVIALHREPSGTAMAAFSLRPNLFGEAKAEQFARALYALANLAVDTPMISLCHIAGNCQGPALAMALKCDIVVVAAAATLSVSWRDAAAAAVHSSGAERVGAAACERLLFERTCGAAEAVEAGLAAFICDDFVTGISRSIERLRTVHATARASRLMCPFPLEAAIALARPFDAAS